MTDHPQHPRPVALITGGARRLGAAMARHLHRQGYDLILHYQQSVTAAEELQETLHQQRADSVHLVCAELSDPHDVRRLAARAIQCFGRLDALINNASQFFPTPLASADDQHWQRLFDTNVRAPFILAQALADSLRLTRGSILNIVDIYGQRPLPGHSLYSASKAALLSLTQSLALELAPDIRVNGIAPGAILWPDPTQSPPSNESDRNYQQALLQKVALGRRGEPDDIARTAWFLLAEAPYITGQVINVDGGRTLTI